ncbi:MAG: PKD domain-containing protein [Bacteroidota bacterium]|nr:PKD domain-containing protein [Bacteroidota bacterium]
MKKTILRSLLFLLFASTINGYAQKNTKFNFNDPTENFYTTQKRLNKHFKKYAKELERERKEKSEGKLNVGAEEEEELAGYELYKRWENFMAPRVYPSGDKTLASKAYEEYEKYSEQLSIIASQNKNIGSISSILSATWQPVGPMGDPSGGNVGRINAVRFDPTNSNGLWACAPDGGLWSTSNMGASWSTNTDQLSVIGSSDVVFDPTNPLNMFMATGDGDAGDSYSIGVLKSTNGGISWSTTGLSWTVNQGRRINKLLINPQNKNTIIAATTVGLYRTQNGGTTWSAVIGSGNIMDVEYKPGDTTTVYAVSTSFFLSTNGGNSFSTITSGLPSSSSNNRLAIAVTPANASYVYVVASASSNSGFLGFYQSTNSGVTFTSKATSPNLLGWASAGTDTGGQGWYTLSIAASPTNANEVVVGGVNIWRTTNGGTNWSLFGHWTGSGAPYVHADIHDLIYKNTTTLFVGSDGGVFYTSNSGTSFAAINGNMNISQIYKIGLSANTYSLAITGLQDNGTNLFSGGWNQTMGGDGMACFIDRTNDLVMYGSQYNGSLNRSTNGGAAWTAITTGLSGSAPWVTPWHQDPSVANTIYCGYSQMFKSTNQGTNWTQIGTLGGSGQIVEFAVAPSNNQVIYAIRGNALYKTTNGGTSWTAITGTLPTGSAQLTWVAVKDTDPNTAFVTFSGYSAGNKVFKTTNGGTTWTNYSTGLPNLPTNCVTYWNGTTNDGVYVGCDVGIYYRDNSMTSWTLYNAGLPNTSVHDLAIFYPLGKLRAATYGRGVWEADLYNNGTMAPIANFGSNKQVICPGDVVNFSDLSTFGPTTWNWTFQSGTPSTSAVQNPSVTYNTPGTYSVSLSASNINGTSVMTKTLYIVVSPTNNLLPLVEGFQGVTFPPTNWQNYDAGSDGLKWTKNSTVGKASTASLFYDNYNLNSSGVRDEMRTPKYNFMGYTNIKMYFDVAYARYDATYSDSLAVMVSTDCGITFTQQYLKGGVTLATAPDLTSSLFVPTAAQWRTDTVYLSSYSGNSNVMIALQNRGRYGQGLYIDNINITGALAGLPPTANFAYSSITPCSGQTINFSDLSTNLPTSWNWSFPGGTPATASVANPTVTYATAGTYVATLISTNINGSSAPINQTLTVASTPTLSANSQSICYGSSTILTASGASSYSWNTGSTSSSITVFPSFNTTYTVTGSSGGSCNAIKVITVTVNSVPNIGTADTTICSGTSATLNATGAISYTWDTGATGASIVVTPTSSITYTVTGFDGTCSNANIVNVTVAVCTGITNVNGSISNGIFIIPNPNNGRFSIKSDNYEYANITVYNNLGQLILTIPYSKNMINIDLTKHGRGIYNLVINANDSHKTIKVLVD